MTSIWVEVSLTLLARLVASLTVLFLFALKRVSKTYENLTVVIVNIA